MFYAVSWLVVTALLALWSLGAWGLHGVAVWAVSSAGALSGAASGAGTVVLPDILAPWVPPALAQALTQLMSGLVPWIDSLLQAAPALAGGLTVLAWAVWGLGAVLLVLMGVAFHVLIALWRRGSGGTGPKAGHPLVVG